MPHDPVQAATALARLQHAQEQFNEAQQARRLAILEAVRTDNPLREVARTANCSHETVRRFVAADGAVTIEFDREYWLSGQTMEFVLYRVAGFGRGAFRANPAVHGTDTAWLEVADHLAGQLEAARSDESGESVRLDRETAFALHQSLLQSALTYPSTLADLVAALATKYRPHAA
jgi:hypothetical protein